ncbi:MAG: hypothetical protein ACYS8I_08960 [Planctomycetota bacterium]
MRRISVLALVGSFAVGLVLAEDCATKANDESAESNVGETAVDIETARARRQAERILAVQKRLEAEQKRLKDEDLKKGEVLSKYSLLLSTKPQSESGRVLVIPAEQGTTEQFLAITEDMTVMSHIFDEKLGRSRRALAHWFTVTAPGYSAYPAISYGTGVTESIYIDGYGALFLMKVDFPLSPPPAAPAEEKPEEGVDQVWLEAKRKILEPEENRPSFRRRPARDTGPEEKYEAEKVEDLKRRLTKALKHAANIRNLRPNDLIILSITGSGQPSKVTSQIQTVGGPGRQVVVTSRIGDHTETTIYKTAEEAHAAISASRTTRYSPTVMTFRIRKADVDVFSKGEMDFDTFHRKVQIFMH